MLPDLSDAAFVLEQHVDQRTALVECLLGTNSSSQASIYLSRQLTTARVLLLGVAVHVALSQPAIAGTMSAAELEDVCNAHQASVQLIRSLTCRVEFQYREHVKGKHNYNTMGSFWYSSKHVRGKYTEHGIDVDYIWRDGITKGVVRQGKDRFMSLRPSSKHNNELDPYVRGLLVIHVPFSFDYRPLNELLKLASRTPQAEWRTIDDKKLAVITLYFDRDKSRPKSWTIDVYFDPDVNYLIRKTVHATVDGVISQKAEVTAYREPEKGIFFPVRVERNIRENGELILTTVAEIQELALNKPLPAGIFDLASPPGILVLDGVKDQRYRVDAHGNVVSKIEPLPHVPPPPDIQSREPLREETKIEPAPFTRWLLPLSLAIVGIALTIGAVRRWKKFSR